MQQKPEHQTRKLRWGVPASAAAHALVVALLIFGFPVPPPEKPREPETVDVEIVPPPEPQEAELPEPEPPEQAEAEEQPQPPDAAAAQAPPPIQVLRPVFRFGEEDAGPRIAGDGNAAEEAEPEETAAEPDEQVATIPAEKPPEPLTEAKTLYSQSATQALAAMNAMDGMPRDRRAGELCVTELREQLRRAPQRYRPDLLPAYRLSEGTVMEVRDAAFRADGRWYDLAFRCEIDADATRVVSFAFDIGEPIPRGEWQARGLPAS